MEVPWDFGVLYLRVLKTVRLYIIEGSNLILLEGNVCFFVLGVSIIGLMLWFGMPNMQNAFKPVEVISVTITLNNKCSVDNDSFVVTVPGTNLVVPFKKGVARLRLKSDRKVQLQSNPKYEAVRYTGIHVPVEPKMILEADCSTSPRLKGIFGSMKNQFKN